MQLEEKFISALLKTHQEYLKLFEVLGDKRYLHRANNCIEIIRQHFLQRGEISD